MEQKNPKQNTQHSHLFIDVTPRLDKRLKCSPLKFYQWAQSPFSTTFFHLSFLFSESLWRQWDFRHSVLLTLASLSWCLGLCHFIAFSFWLSRYSWNLCIWVKGNIGSLVSFISNMHPWKEQLYCHCYIIFWNSSD